MMGKWVIEVQTALKGSFNLHKKETFCFLVCISMLVYSGYKGLDWPSHSKLSSLHRLLSAASLTVQLLEKCGKTNEQERRSTSNWRGCVTGRPSWLKWSGADNNAIRLCETA